MNKYLLLFVFISTIECAIAQSDTSIVFLGDIDSTIITDVKYATTDNFTGKILYPTNKVYTRKIVGDKLKEINSFLKQNYNYRLKIFDAFRPLSVQKKMWEVYPDPNYVADPAKGSRHNRGAAVDLTIIDSTGIELDMGTQYDDFTEKAWHNYNDFSKEIIQNRKLLFKVMIKFGFLPLESEWWHYDYNGWEKFSIIDFKLD